METPSHFRPDLPPQGEPEFKVVEKPEYIGQLSELIPQATDRVWVQSMTFDANEPFLTLKDLLKDASARGVDTRYTVDMYHKLLVGGSLYYLPELSPAKRELIHSIKTEREASLNDLVQNNVKVTITNPPHTMKERLNPARGRNHIKMAIIDDLVFMGDIHNLVSKNQPGIMIKVTDPLLVEGLSNLYQAAEITKGTTDYEVIGSDGTALLIDNGTPKKSLIMERAKAAVNNAESSIKMTSQHTPDGDIIGLLQAAQDRGVAVSTIIADAKVITRPLSRLFDARSQLIFKKAGFTIPVLEAPNWIHSNILLIDEDLPTAQTIVGTRCFSGTLVDWGTQEIALQSQNPDLLEQLKAHVQDLGAQATPRKSQRTVTEIIFQK